MTEMIWAGMFGDIPTPRKVSFSEQAKKTLSLNRREQKPDLFQGSWA